MRANREAQQTVQGLRQQGLSYREILQHVPVSKSSVSLWCRTIVLNQAQQQVLEQRKSKAGQHGLATIAQLRQSGKLIRRPSVRRHTNGLAHDDRHEVERVRALYGHEQLSVREVAARMGVSFWHVYTLMRRHRIPRRRGSEQNYATYKTKPRFKLKSSMSSEEEQLRIAGAMLYWAEGAKTQTSVNLANSDPKLISLFVTFLRRICGIAEERLRVRVYAYADQDIERLTSFWAEVTGVPLHQFIKPYVRELTANVTGRKMRWGLVQISYSDRRLLRLILDWAEEFSQSWAGT